METSPAVRGVDLTRIDRFEGSPGASAGWAAANDAIHSLHASAHAKCTTIRRTFRFGRYVYLPESFICETKETTEGALLQYLNFLTLLPAVRKRGTVQIDES